MKKIAILAILLLIMIDSTSAQYVMQSSVFASGGAQASGTAYGTTGTIGQSSPVGISSGSTYTTHHGFWHAVGGGGVPLEAMILAIELISPSMARLSWVAVSGATVYDIYRSTSPYFTATGSPWETVVAPAVQYDFSDGVGNPGSNYFFKGLARNASQTSPESNTVGEFDSGMNGNARRPISRFDSEED